MLIGTSDHHSLIMPQPIYDALGGNRANALCQLVCGCVGSGKIVCVQLGVRYLKSLVVLIMKQ